eukprot:c28014_g1_i1 orf=536-1573(+)
MDSLLFPITTSLVRVPAVAGLRESVDSRPLPEQEVKGRRLGFYLDPRAGSGHPSFVFKTRPVERCRISEIGGRLHPLNVVCSSSKGPSSSSNNTYRWDEDDEQYVEAHVLEAVSLLPSHGQLFMTLANGGQIEVDHVHPAKGRLLYRSRNPTIFLKIHDESDLLLPIVVGEVAITMLMRALHGDEKAGRPNHYHLMRDLVVALNHEVRMIRITERVIDTYYARIFLGKPGEEEMQSVDARPSDAINLAVRCMVPIYVNRAIVAADAVRPVYTTVRSSGRLTDSILRTGSSSSLDFPESGPDPMAEEITLMKNMLLAVVEERYTDAARWRDDLNKLRASRRQIRQM